MEVIVCAWLIVAIFLPILISFISLCKDVMYYKPHEKAFLFVINNINRVKKLLYAALGKLSVFYAVTDGCGITYYGKNMNLTLSADTQQRVTLNVTAFDAHNNVTTLPTDITYSTDNGAVVQIDGNQLVICGVSGDANITACSAGLSATLHVTITAGVAAKLELIGVIE